MDWQAKKQEIGQQIMQVRNQQQQLANLEQQLIGKYQLLEELEASEKAKLQVVKQRAGK